MELGRAGVAMVVVVGVEKGWPAHSEASRTGRSRRVRGNVRGVAPTGEKALAGNRFRSLEGLKSRRTEGKRGQLGRNP